jgi:iron complex transport system substrate-binding protein
VNAARRAALAVTLSLLFACAPPPAEPRSAGGYSRVVTLAPNLTELVFAAGAGDVLVGVSAYSDYPPAARQLPVVGDAFSVDRERLALLDPDALFVWQSGTPAHVVDQLREAGFRVEVLRTRSLDDVIDTLRRIGELTGRRSSADLAADRFSEELAALRRDYSGSADISVFYQVSRRPLFTINGEHYVSELISICGGSNVFADLGELAPAVSAEAVVARDPEVMLASDEGGEDTFSEWRRWPGMAANRYRNLFLIAADEVGRATPRVVAAGRAICAALDEARGRRDGLAEG